MQIEKTTQTVAQQTAEQQRMAQQNAETGRAMAKFTLELKRVVLLIVTWNMMGPQS
jgi:hypothetical protein